MKEVSQQPRITQKHSSSVRKEFLFFLRKKKKLSYLLSLSVKWDHDQPDRTSSPLCREVENSDVGAEEPPWSLQLQGWEICRSDCGPGVSYAEVITQKSSWEFLATCAWQDTICGPHRNPCAGLRLHCSTRWKHPQSTQSAKHLFLEHKKECYRLRAKDLKQMFHKRRYMKSQ